ncbi:hypothetical protein C8Q76DRAFT_695733 [Earliella scabrosa]|nr:hypothetical protein C8Q76DRAFT_695733 [Earliella scabrosa]
MDGYFQFQDHVANRLLQLFEAELHPDKHGCGVTLTPPGPDQPELAISEELENDLMRAAIILAQAWTYRVPMCWHADDLRASLSKKQNGLNPAREDELLDIFQPFCEPEEVKDNQVPILYRPGMVVDGSGNVLVWHLPGLLSEGRQNQILGATEHIKFKLKTCGNAGHPDLRWRDSDTYFQPGNNWPPGVWLASPAGYAVGHKVRNSNQDHRPRGDPCTLSSPELSTPRQVGRSEHPKVESGQ